jgi:enoyl-CoA hydratase
VRAGERLEKASPTYDQRQVGLSVLTCRQGPVLVITIDRPEVRNAIDGAVAAALVSAYGELDNDPELRAGVVTGAGDAFSSGMDLREFATSATPLDDRFLSDPPSKPVVAAVEGFALAAGFELVLSCDLVVAARGARFGLPEVTRGLVASGGGVLRLVERCPYAVALELALTGEPVTAERAEALGLVNSLVEPGNALEAAIALAQRIARNAPLAVVAAKRLVREARGAAINWERQREIGASVLASADALEGARAFAERRPARWSGS